MRFSEPAVLPKYPRADLQLASDQLAALMEAVRVPQIAICEVIGPSICRDEEDAQNLAVEAAV